MPTLLLDKEKCLANMERMAGKARGSGLGFRPHFKTHQSAEIGSWFRDFGVERITVSSFRMAAYFSRAGWKDILVAFPFHPGEKDALREMSRTANMSILLDDTWALPALKGLDYPVEFYVDVDTGYGRSGIPALDPERTAELIRQSENTRNLKFKGFYCHAGHSYKAASRNEMEDIHHTSMRDLQRLKDLFRRFQPMVLYGDTPNCSLQVDFGPVDELTPGNFVFYDLTQVDLGSCDDDQIAVAMSCPVSGRYPGNKLLVHGGAVHFSKEVLEWQGMKAYGQVAEAREKGWGQPRDIFLTGLSQEHGTIENCGALWDQVRPGDELLILPVHSCLTANLMGSYRTLGGETITTLHAC